MLGLVPFQTGNPKAGMTADYAASLKMGMSKQPSDSAAKIWR
jgi:hypothetical protein